MSDNNLIEKIEDKNSIGIIKAIISGVKKKYPGFLGLYVFGSRQKGGFTKHSDLDIMLVFRKKPDWKERKIIIDLIYDFDLEYDMVIDAKIYSLPEIENYNTPFTETVFKEGIFNAA